MFVAKVALKISSDDGKLNFRPTIRSLPFAQLIWQIFA